MNNCWLETYLNLAKPYATEELISQEAWQQIEHLVPMLPSFSSSILECRLVADNPQVDFSIYMQQKLPAHKKIPNDPIWQRIQNFYQHWSNPSSPLFDICESALEFDLDGAQPDVPIPSFFFTLANKIFTEEINGTKKEVKWQTLNNAKEILAQVWEIMKEENIPHSLQKNLWNCFALMPPNTYIYAIGMMLSRTVQTTRLELGEFTIDSVVPYLESIGWKGESHCLTEMMAIAPAEFSTFRLAFDVGEQIYPRVGLLYHLPNPTRHDPRWQKFLEILVRHQLCTPKKYDAIQNWHGYTQVKGHSEALPQILANVSTLKENQLLNVMERLFRTMKIVYQPGQPFEAKAYLLYSYLDILMPRT